MCHTLQELHCTGEPMQWETPRGGSFRIPVGSSMFKQVCMHPDKREAPDAEGKYPICLGTNSKI